MKKELSTANAVLLGSLIIAISILLGFKLFGSNNLAAKQNFVDPDSVYAGEPFKKEEYLNGSGDKKVVLVEFSDLECPFCKQLHSDVADKIFDTYKDKIDIIFKHFPLPFHTKAPNEAVATMCARDIGGQLVYRNYIEKLYDVTEGNNKLDPKMLPEIAGMINLNKTKFADCQSNSTSTIAKMKQIQDDLADGQAAGVDGTPATLVLIKEGSEYRILSKIAGARDYKYFSKIIDQALKQ